MGRAALVAIIGMLVGQKPDRPIFVGVLSAFPTGRWGSMKGPFPETGYSGYSIGAMGAKAHYNRKGSLGWFIFFQAISWEVSRQKIASSLTGSPISDTTNLSRLQLPFSNIGGAGVIYRKILSPSWHLTIPIDLRITYLSYRFWELNKPSGEKLFILMHSNSFIGFGVSPTVWRRIEEGKKGFIGFGISYPLVWGRAAPYTIKVISPSGEVSEKTQSYYLPPQYIELQFLLAFQP